MKGLFRSLIIFILLSSSANAASVITYDLNAAPLATDQLLMIDDPSGSWAVNRVAVSSLFSLITDAYLTDTLTIGASGSINALALPANIQTYNSITPSANVQAILAAATYAAIRTLLDLEAGTDFYSIAAADAAFEAKGVIEADISDLGTAVTLNADASLSGNSWFLDEDAFTSDSATKVASQQSIKAYVDGKKLDDFAAPDDNTDLDVSTSAHGLCPKAPNDTDQWLRGDGVFAVSPYNGYALTVSVGDVSMAGSVYIPVPYAGTVTLIQSTIDAAITTANSTITASIGGVAITDGVITITFTGSTAGDIDSCSPSAANTVAAGSVIRLLKGGESDTASNGFVTIWIER